MRVRDCETCAFHERRRWSREYRPKSYHTIGMTHAYGYCRLHEKRCLQVKACEKSEVGRGRSADQRVGRKS